MRRLCTESSRSYAGRSAALGGVVLMAMRPGWGRTRNHLARDRVARSQGERSDSNPSGHVARPAVMQRVRSQKSAAAILVVRRFTRVADHEGPNM